MLKVLVSIKDIEIELDRKIAENQINDYRVSLKLDSRIVVNILVEKTGIVTYSFSENPRIPVTELTNQQLTDTYYQSIFENKQKIDFGLRRRFSTLLSTDLPEFQNSCPIITFYSYKGGMGRTTALATFAAYYAQTGKKVLIIDCDFEAPGFTNFFDLSTDILSQQNGLAEYLSDKEFEPNSTFVSNYIYEVSKKYSGDGSISIIPAGNLTDFNAVPDKDEYGLHLNHYLEALSRIDFTNTKNLLWQFERLFSDIRTELNPDLILLDSRTGFNDIFGFSAFVLSDFVVGFFGSNLQNAPGMHYFLNSIYDTKKDMPIILVNSIISDSRFYENFKAETERIASSLPELPFIDKFALYREPMLEQIGTSFEYKDNFISFIKSPSKAYKDLFDALIEKLKISNNHVSNEEINIVDEVEKQKENYKENIKQVKGVKVVGKIDLDKIKDKTKALKSEPKLKDKQFDTLFGYRLQILKNYSAYQPFLYAEDTIKIDKDFFEKKFYFRNCMYDIFNTNKFLFIGGKGTGKTYLYRAFRDEKFVEKLRLKANVQKESVFIPIIELQKDKQIHLANHLSFSTLNDSDLFFSRFWLIYIWNVISRHSYVKKVFPYVENKTKLFDISNFSTTLNDFETIIRNNDLYIEIEKYLSELDKKIQQNALPKIYILFDQLDFIVKPLYWNKGITPLIELCRRKPFTSIIPKLFIRRDLYAKLGNLTNKEQMKETLSVSLEWTNDEMFAFFFKAILSDSRKEFFELMQNAQDVDVHLIKESQDLTKDDNQIPTQKEYLLPFIYTFFGRWSNPNEKARFGENYDWFYKNLENADHTISLRPFIEMINFAVKNSLSKIEQKDSYEIKRITPILHPNKFANSDARKVAVSNHFIDLAGEEGNTDLSKIFDYIKRDFTRELCKDILERKELYLLLKGVIEKTKDTLQHKAVDELLELLTINGIIAIDSRKGGYTSYRFARLYKYYLGLTSKRNNFRK